jgi:hypothetical protein
MTHSLRQAWPASSYAFPLARLAVPKGGRNFITPDEYVPSLKGKLVCPGDGCEAPLIFVSGYRREGSRDIPNLFRTDAGHRHDENCNHEEACAQNAGDRTFDPAIGLRFHLNKAVHKGLTVSRERLRKFEEEELPLIDPLYRRREIVNVRGARDFTALFALTSIERLADSRVRYQDTLPTLSDFLVSGKSRFSALFNALSGACGFQDGLPRLFYLRPEKWMDRAQAGTAPHLICQPHSVDLPEVGTICLEPRLTFGAKDSPPSFDPLKRLDVGSSVLTLAVPKLFPLGRSPAQAKKWILYLDVTNPDLALNGTLPFARAPKEPELRQVPLPL